MSEPFPCKSIDCTKFGAVVWHDMGPVKSTDEGKPDLLQTRRIFLIGAFYSFDDAVNCAILLQERADVSCKEDGYENKGIIWAERTSGNSLPPDS